MATQNVFVTKTENRFLPIIQAFTDNLYKNMQAQQQLADRTMAFNMKVKSDDFISQYGNKLTNSKSLEELSSNLGKAITDAGSQGLQSVIPILSSVAQVHQQKIGIEDANKQADEFIGLMAKTYKGSMVLQDGKPVSMDEAIAGLQNIKDPLSRRMNAEFLVKNMLKEFKTILPTDKGYAYSEGYVDANNKVYNSSQYNIYEEKGKVLTDYGKAGDKTDDRELDPLVAKEYGIYKKQDKQLQSYMSRVGGSDGSGGVNTQPSKWYEDPKTKKSYAAWWDKKSNRYKTLINGKETIINDNNLIKDRTATTEFKEMAINNLGIVSDLEAIASETGKKESIKLLQQAMVMNPSYYKEVPTDVLEDYARSLAREIGDNWEAPKNEKLKRLKKRLGNQVPNPFVTALSNIGINITTPTDTVIANSYLNE